MKLQKPSAIVRDGGWTILLNVAGKSQSFTIILAGVVVGGLDGVGRIAASIACATLSASIADFGLSAETGRYVGSNPTRSAINTVRSACVPRLPVAVILAPLLMYATVYRNEPGSPLSYLSASIYGLCIFVSGVALNCLYGLQRFRAASVRLGVFRVASAATAVAMVITFRSATLVVWSFAVGEALGSIAMLIEINRSAPCRREEPAPAQMTRSHYWLGISSAVNILVNQSDVLLVSAVASPRVLGAFAILSQLQNGIGTLALSAASPVPTYVARAVQGRRSFERELSQALRSSLRLASLAACLIFGGFTVYAVVLRHTSLLASSLGWTAMLICLGAALPSAAAGVHFGVAVGGGRYRSIGTARVWAGTFAAAALIVLTATLGLLGAATATLVRDSFLLVASLRCSRAVRAESLHDAIFEISAPLEGELHDALETAV